MSYESSAAVDRAVASLFQPDILITPQFFEHFRARSRLDPEKRLMLAVLQDAVECLQKYASTRDAKGKVLYQEAAEWVLDEESEELFSFQNICEVLGFNPAYIRRGLFKKRRLAS